MGQTWDMLVRGGRVRHDRRFRQHAALPLMIHADGRIEVGLITSRETGRWVIPKGWPKRRLTAPQLAAKEARDEAGLVGEISATPIGAYTYRKRLHMLASVTCTVDVFVLFVTHQRRRWREAKERTLAWFSPEEAAKAVNEPDLARILEKIADSGLPADLFAMRDGHASTA